ncbi:MAG TPA: hypothetical protein VJ873_04055 [bacterium]|nr:hypothetical protein [bacterium]
MKKLGVMVFLLSGLVQAVGADSSAVPHSIHRPYFLQAKDKVPRSDLACPEEDLQGPGAKSLDLEINILPPDPHVIDFLSGPDIFEQIQRQRPSETALQRFYWHRLDEVEYCHFRDMEGNHWYGWEDGDEKFNWVLWRGHRFWWHDPFAGLWLYYYQGYWWRADGQKPGRIQACIDGEYYACDAKGNILQDMGQEGSGDIVSAPGRYQGDFRHGGHGGHHGNGQWNHNNAQPSQGSPQGGNASPSQNTNPSGSPSGNE